MRNGQGLPPRPTPANVPRDSPLPQTIDGHQREERVATPSVAPPVLPGHLRSIAADLSSSLQSTPAPPTLCPRCLRPWDAAATGHQVCPPCHAALPGPARDPSPMDEAASPAPPSPPPGQVPDVNVHEVRSPAALLTCCIPADHIPDRIYLNLTSGGGTCRRDGNRSLKSGPSNVLGAGPPSCLPKKTVGAV
jgi:hypothetical protein